VKKPRIVRLNATTPITESGSQLRVGSDEASQHHCLLRRGYP
jgi:hypothetical protein